MPYALVAADGSFFAALADGELWESPDRGDSWRRCELSQKLEHIVALAAG